MKPSHLTSYQDFMNQFHKKPPSNRSQHNKNTPINSSKNHYQSYQHQSESQKTQRVQLTHQKNAHLQKTPTNKSDASISKKSIIQMSYNKFINEITQILFKISKLKGSDLLAHRISYIEYLQCLKSLKMIRDSYEPQPNDLVGQLWSECISKSTIANLILIIGAILKYSNISQEQQKKHGLNDYLVKKYQPLKLTRFELNGSNRTEKIDNTVAYKFQPNINKRSRYLANKSNSKQNHVPHGSYSAQKVSKLNRSKNQILRNNTQLSFEGDSQSKNIIKEQNSFNLDCTPGKKKNEIKDKSVGKKRSQILYKMAKSTQKRQDKSQNDIQYQKSVKELTFKPILTRNKSNEKLSKQRIKGQSNSISRAIKGRVQRQIKQLISQKGTTYNEKTIDKIRRQKYKEAILKIHPDSQGKTQKDCTNAIQQPQIQEQQEFLSKQCSQPIQNLDKNIIIVNIFIEQDRAQKLIYYHGHETLSDAASRFVKQYNLSSKQHQKLIRELENVMKNTLTSIQQQQQLSTEHS